MNYQSALVQLPLVREAGKERVVTPTDVYRVCADIAHLAQESFHVLCVNARNQVLNRHMISLGLVDTALVHSREVFRAAIQDGSSAIILAHNHPSGDPTPSAEDLRITRQLIEVGKIVDIKVLDHVVIGRAVAPLGDTPGRTGYLSLRESGLVVFE
jgi:DNA repair protein RadC